MHVPAASGRQAAIEQEDAHQNLFWAFAYNAVGIALAVAGLLNPFMAAGAMVVSSLSVILNSMRASGSGILERRQPPESTSVG